MNQENMLRYVALLRGINVGGKNLVKMLELKAAFEEMRFMNVATFIQSGNVLFDTAPKDRAGLVKKIEAALSKRFGYSSRVVLVSRDEIAAAVTKAPKGFGKDPDEYRYDVFFLLPPLKPAEAIKSIPVKEGVDAVHAGKSVLYFSRLIAKAAQSRLPRLTSMPIYKRMTIRNWKTTTTLLGLMNETGTVR